MISPTNSPNVSVLLIYQSSCNKHQKNILIFLLKQKDWIHCENYKPDYTIVIRNSPAFRHRSGGGWELFVCLFSDNYNFKIGKINA